MIKYNSTVDIFDINVRHFLVESLLKTRRKLSVSLEKKFFSRTYACWAVLYHMAFLIPEE